MNTVGLSNKNIRFSDYLELTGREPYRLLFPLGLLLAILGVSLWPLNQLSLYSVSPSIAHPRIMIQGFVNAFILGFLGTAFPRLLESRPLTKKQSWLFACLLLILSIAHAAGFFMVGDLLFVLCLVSFVFCLFSRFTARKANPPPNFILVALGIFSGLSGGLIELFSFVSNLPPPLIILGRRLLFEGFPLLPILGVGSFLLVRFLKYQKEEDFIQSVRSIREWKKKAILAFVMGISFIGSFLLESFHFYRTASFLKLSVFLAYLVFPLLMDPKALPQKNTMAFWTRFSVLAFPFGYILLLMDPNHALGWLHNIFILGVGLLIFVVATRVIFGHSGQQEKFAAKLLFLSCSAIIFLVATILRIVADFDYSSRLLVLSFSSLLWIGGCVLWALFVLPSVLIPDRG
ncbi:NnrS family protein [Methylacidiphilum caldifontis]|uniref:NnrS family protein n=1 Tax=Methylacidiphilum caldifontis TaxID=2795386 RepID=UPI001A8DC9D1|nr:NnrS family protein [Methylacidiphilum caldifontis]QSR88494.1 NnrS family protein [Methylacidiphilum caldifontis]